MLLLEAGADESEASDIPVLANHLQKGLFDWQYQVRVVTLMVEVVAIFALMVLRF